MRSKLPRVCLVLSLLGSDSFGADQSSYADAYRAGQDFAKSGKLAEARKQFVSALDLATTGSEKASALVGIGETYDSEQNTAAARAEFEKALAVTGITPDQAGQTLLFIADGYGREYKWQPANAALEKVLAMNGVSNDIQIKAHLAVGLIFENYGDWTRVKAANVEALKTPGIDRKQKTLARKPLAKALVNLRQYAESRSVMKELLADETLPSAFRATTQTSVGKTLLYERSYAEARMEFGKTLAMPDVSESLQAEIQLHIGLSYYEAQDYEHAKPELMKVLEMPGASVRPPWDGGRVGYAPRREAILRLRLRSLIPDDDGQKVLKVLFIGSSHTFRGDVPEMVTQLAASAPADRPRIIAGDFIRMGTTINTFWNAGDTPDTARGVIAAEPWDAVVFETFYTMNRDDLLKYGTLFADLIRRQNAQPALYESPIAQASAYPDAYQQFHDANVTLAKVLKAPVAPSVQAWMQYLGPKPTAGQFGAVYADWIHATPQGAYMTACCIYSALTGFSPVGLDHPGIPEADAKLLQQAAWTAFLESNLDVKR